MRPKVIFPTILFTIFILTAIFWLRPNQRTSIPTPEQTLVKSINQISNDQTIANQAILSQNQQLIQQSNKNVTSTNTAKIEEGTKAFVERRNKPIDFYCRFIDQDSNAVPGVKVKFGIERLLALNPAQMEIGSKLTNLERITDTDGRAEIHGEIGDGIGIGSVTKEGYQLSSKAPLGFGGSSGSYNNPVVLKMWKLGEKAKLIDGSMFWKIPPDGKFRTIDFLQKTVSDEMDATGDIRVSISRPSQIKPHTHFEWSFSIEAIQGGILSNQDDFMYLAPEIGYQPNCTFVMPTNNPEWKGELDGMQFYFRSRDGQVYGNFKFDLIPDYNKVSVLNISWSANSSGSRNLQP